ncbi:MAG: helix-turn-helix domain-containing protein [Peptococcaceae bacterium]|nr:helix-turn-helix domain-containing protein [Peptococcaceae bacterium]
MTLGERLKEARERRGFTQVYVAKQLGITNTAVSNYERGERDPDTALLKRLAELYDVSTDYLLGSANIPEIDIQEALEGNDVKITFGGRLLTSEERLEVLKVLNRPPDSDTKKHVSDTVFHELVNNPGKTAGNDVYYNDIDAKLEKAVIAASHQGRQVMKQVPPGLRELIKNEIIQILEERKGRKKHKTNKDTQD